MNKFSNWIVRAGLANASELRGLEDLEIVEIEKSRGISLPGDYKDFLRQCGRFAGLFGRDIDILFPYLLRLNEEFLVAAKEFDIKFNPPANAFFFSAYQGGSFHYFLCGDIDRNIYVVNDGDTIPTLVSDSFTSFMRAATSSYQDAFFQSPDKSWMIE